MSLQKNNRAPLKPRTCKVKSPLGVVCGETFIPRSSLQVVCSPMCAVYKTAQDKAKKATKQAAEQRAAHRVAKVKAKTRGDYAREAQIVFNAFIRARDKDKPCVSCGSFTGKKNAGHYRSVGSAPECRFMEINAHLQCEKCNSYLSGNLIPYRVELIKRIGLEQVDYLEGKHEAAHLSIDVLIGIKTEYRRKLNEIAV